MTTKSFVGHKDLLSKWVDLNRRHPYTDVVDSLIAGVNAAMGFRVVEIESTPNPNAMKFVLDSSISPHPMSFLTAESAASHPLARRLFEIPGVSSLLLLGDFVTINKSPAGKWDDIKTQARRILKSAS